MKVLNFKNSGITSVCGCVDGEERIQKTPNYNAANGWRRPIKYIKRSTGPASMEIWVII